MLEENLMISTLNYHGKELLQSLVDKQGSGCISLHTLQRRVTYGDSQKVMDDICSANATDRLKKLKKLHSFISQKAHLIFRKSVGSEINPRIIDSQDEDYYAIMPPLEFFMGVPEKERRIHFLKSLKKGDLLIGFVQNKLSSGLVLKILYMDGGINREVRDLDIKALCSFTHVEVMSAHENPVDAYQIKDILRAVVIEILADDERLFLSMKSEHLQNENDDVKLGLVSEEDYPVYYKQMIKVQGDTYENVLSQTLGFMNPNNVTHLSSLMGISNCRPSFMKGLSGIEYPSNDYAIPLRKAQSAKWAYQSVADGIKYFKSGQHGEAFQCLNKALQIDPENVEALVARGALFANNSSFKKAVEDFESALKINSDYKNASKYLCETLIALGKQYEDKDEVDQAFQCYSKVLKINPLHQEARESITQLEEKKKSLLTAKLRLSASESSIPSRKDISASSNSNNEKLLQLLKQDIKKDRSKRKRRSTSSSSSSSSSSTSSATSSSTSSSSSSTSSKSDTSQPSRKEKRSKSQRKSSHRKKYHKDSKKYSAKRTKVEPPSIESINATQSSSFWMMKNTETIKSELNPDSVNAKQKNKKEISMFDPGSTESQAAEHSIEAEPSKTDKNDYSLNLNLNFDDLKARLQTYYQKFETTDRKKEDSSIDEGSEDNSRNKIPFLGDYKKSDRSEFSKIKIEEGKVVSSPKVVFLAKADEFKELDKKYLPQPHKDSKKLESDELRKSSSVLGSKRTSGNLYEGTDVATASTRDDSDVKQRRKSRSHSKHRSCSRSSSRSKSCEKSSKSRTKSRRKSRSSSRSYRSRSRSRSRKRSKSKSKSHKRSRSRSNQRSRSRSRSHRRSHSRSLTYSRSRTRSRSHSRSSSDRSHSRSRRSRRHRSKSSTYSRSRSRSYDSTNRKRSYKSVRYSIKIRERKPYGYSHSDIWFHSKYRNRPPFHGRNQSFYKSRPNYNYPKRGFRYKGNRFQGGQYRRDNYRSESSRYKSSSYSSRRKRYSSERSSSSSEREKPRKDSSKRLSESEEKVKEEREKSPPIPLAELHEIPLPDSEKIPKPQFDSLEEVESLLEKHNALKKAEILAKNKDIKKKW